MTSMLDFFDEKILGTLKLIHEGTSLPNLEKNIEVDGYKEFFFMCLPLAQKHDDNNGTLILVKVSIVAVILWFKLGFSTDELPLVFEDASESFSKNFSEDKFRKFIRFVKSSNQFKPPSDATSYSGIIYENISTLVRRPSEPALLNIYLACKNLYLKTQSQTL